MEISEFNAYKRQMELEIVKATYQAVEKFKEKTKYSPGSIYVQMVETSTLGNPYREFTVADCKTDVEI